MNMENDNEPADESQASLEDFFDVGEIIKASPKKSPSSSPTSTPVSDNRTEIQLPPSKSGKTSQTPDSVSLSKKTNSGIGTITPSKNLPPSFLLSIDYEGYQKKAKAQLYNPETKKMNFWYDTSGHQPYCYSDIPPQVVESKVKLNRGFLRTETVEIQDLLRDETRIMTKVIAKDPLSIGGSSGAIRDLLSERIPSNDPLKDSETISHAWEANIRYRNCYTYDRNLVCGLMYRIENGRLIPSPPHIDDSVLESFKQGFSGDEELEQIISEYAPMFFTEVPDIRRIAIDIEVFSPLKNRIPDSNTSPQPVTAIGLSASEGCNKCLVLRRKGHPEGKKRTDSPRELEVKYYDDEAQMLVDAFEIINDYPLVFTFVGDAFDLNYLYNRAKRLHIDLNRFCPIRLGKEVALLKKGVHVDLYRFLKNPSIRLYALGGAYERNNLDSIAKGLLGVGKLELSTDISSLPYNELAHYCWLDANITLQLTQFNNNLLLRLMVLLMRISRLSMEDVTRLGISSWIQSLFRQEHRSRNCLIPLQREIKELKSSAAQTEAMIKDKAFKGAIVIDPIAGVHFNATVLDFASLYPTIMKRHNISYETVDCPHDECKNATDNRVPETKRLKR